MIFVLQIGRQACLLGLMVIILVKVFFYFVIKST